MRVLTAAERCSRALPIIDGHNDFAFAMRTLVGYDLDAVDFAGGIAGTQTDLPRLAAGGVGGQFWSVFVPAAGPGTGGHGHSRADRLRAPRWSPATPTA